MAGLLHHRLVFGEVEFFHYKGKDLLVVVIPGADGDDILVVGKGIKHPAAGLVLILADKRADAIAVVFLFAVFFFPHVLRSCIS